MQYAWVLRILNGKPLPLISIRRVLIDNVRVIRKKVPQSKIIAVVKANAYGHGLYPVANALSEEADAFAVSYR